MKRLDLVGQRFGKLLVIAPGQITKNGHLKFKCVCDCGKEKEVFGMHLKRNMTKSCGCDTKRGPKHPQWTGYEGISGNWWNCHVANGDRMSRKSRNGIVITITPKFAWELYLKQNKKCALSGVDITIEGRSGSASIDRIDSKGGYTPDNVQWVHKDVNRMKNIYGQEYFLDICRKIASLHPLTS